MENNKLISQTLDGLRLKQGDGVPLPWIEVPEIISSNEIQIEDLDDDIKREKAFYEQALEAANLGKEKIIKEGIKFSRPADYFAEMIKTDDHMEKIRRHLLEKQLSMKRSEDAQKQRYMKKFGKKVQRERLEEQALQKKKELEKIKHLREKRSSTDLERGDVEFEDIEEKLKSTSPHKSHVAAHGKSKKRKRKDERFGFGGKKRGLKRNDGRSSADMSSFGSGKNKKPTKGSKQHRPGKSRRQKQKQTGLSKNS